MQTFRDGSVPLPAILELDDLHVPSCLTIDVEIYDWIAAHAFLLAVLYVSKLNEILEWYSQKKFLLTMLFSIQLFIGVVAC